MPHDHAHLSPSGHPFREDNDAELTYWQTMEIAVRELMVEKDILGAAEIQSMIETLSSRSAADGARVVARAWSDDAFKTRLLDNASAACAELGIDIGPLKLIALENTDTVHNVVVCTLCSCYPRFLLGMPPDWYKTRAYRSRVVKEPRKVLAEFGLNVPGNVQIRVHDSTADMRYIVLPQRPAGTDQLSPDQLEKLVTRDSMIGTGLPLDAVSEHS